LLEIEKGKVGRDYLLKGPHAESRRRSNPR
jgi:hypothetical protein